MDMLYLSIKNVVELQIFVNFSFNDFVVFKDHITCERLCFNLMSANGGVAAWIKLSTTNAHRCANVNLAMFVCLSACLSVRVL